MHGNLPGAKTGEGDDVVVSFAQLVITNSEDNDKRW
jgi:hypothetical protein